MYNFNYHRAQSLQQVSELLTSTEEPKLLAGGMTLLPTLKLRLAQPSDLIDLSALNDLKGIQLDSENNTLTIAALTTHYDVFSSKMVKQAIPALAELAGDIGDPAVRNRGTIGGSIANNDPAADYPAAVVALNATVITTKREIAAEDFFVDMFETALDEDEIIAAVKFPIVKKAAYRKFPNPASRYALAGVMVAITESGVRVAVTGAGPCVFRVTEMEQALDKNFSTDAIADMTISHDELNEDIHASQEYRAHLVTVMAKRAVAAIQ